MKQILKIIGAVLSLAIATIVALILTFGLETVNLKFNQYFSPKYANVKRETFKQSKSYVEGMINDLSDYKREYERAEDDEKQAVLNYIDSHFANFDANLIENNTLYKFLMDVRNGNLK